MATTTKYPLEVIELADAAHMVLVWLGMAYKGEAPVLPTEPYQDEELRLRCLALREARDKIADYDPYKG
jgi:hypothetical protein